MLVRARALHLFIGERFISTLAVYCSQLIAIVVRYFGCISEIQEGIFGNLFTPCLSSHTRSAFIVWEIFYSLFAFSAGVSFTNY